MSSVRDLIESYRREVRDSDLSPERAADLCAKLTALLGNVLGEIRESEMAFNHVLLRLLDSEDKANHARIRAQVTPEYSRWKEAKDAHTVTQELIRSLRQILRTTAEEMRMTR